VSEAMLMDTVVPPVSPPSPGVESLRAQWRRCWRVPPRLSMSEWAERRRVLDARTSARSGPWRNAQMPHAVGIMDAICSPEVRTVTMCASTQGAKTEVLINAIGYFNEQSPGPGMLVYPTRDMCSDILKTRIRPALAMLVATEQETIDAGGQTVDERLEVGASGDDGTAFFVSLSRMNLWATGSNAHAALTSRPIKILIMDEVQHFDADAPGLASERTRSFPDYKNIAAGNPDTVEGYLWQRYLQSDRRTYQVPCPHCGQYQELLFSKLKWDGKLGATQEQVKASIRYECHGCGAEISPGEKPAMLARGVWVPDGMEAARHTGELGGEGGRLGPRDHAGFKWSQLISPFVPWWKVAWEFIHDQKGNPSPTWINSVLGEPFSPPGQHLRWETVKKHFAAIAVGGYETGVVPAEAVCLTAGIDVGDRHLWVAVRAWSPGAKKSWLIHCDRLDAPCEDKAACLAALSEVRRWEFPLAADHPARKAAGDRGMGIWQALLDTGDGDRTDELYGWCLTPCPGGCVLIAGKGRSELGPLSHREAEVYKDAATKEKSDRITLPLFWVSNLYFKNQLAGHLRQRALGESRINAAEEVVGENVDRWYWPAWEDDSWQQVYAQHVTNEKLIAAKTKEGVKLRWVLRREGLPNHLWDADCYAAAAGKIAGVERAAVPPELVGRARRK